MSSDVVAPSPPPPPSLPPSLPSERGDASGVLYRLGTWVAIHVRVVVAVWLVLVAGLGVFAPTVENHLSGAGWQANGSDAVRAREVIDREFGGLSGTDLQVVVASATPIARTPAAGAAVTRVEAMLRADPRVSTVVAPQPGSSLSADGRVAVIQGGAKGDSTAMVRAAADLTGPVRGLSSPGVTVALTGSSSLWADFNKANLSAMLRSEVVSWPVTLAILVLAFGSLVAAGLPLMLTIAGLAASAGVLSLVGQVTHVSVWAMNFALMFALALGIDYALFVVVRFRTALAERRVATVGELGRSDVLAAVGEASEYAGKAVLFSGVTVLVSLSAVMLVPSPAFRSMAFGIMVAVVFVLAATLTLLPAVLGRLGERVNRITLPFARPAAGPSRRFIAWAGVLERHPWRFAAGSVAMLVALAIPVLGLRTGMPSITVIPSTASARVGYNQVEQAFGPGALNPIQVVARADQAAAVRTTLASSREIATVLPTRTSPSGWTLTTAVPTSAPSSRAADSAVTALRAVLPSGVLVGGPNMENHDLHQVLSAKTPPVVGVVLGLGFILLLVALQAPLIAALGVVTNLLAVGAAFGVGRLVFQDGHGAGLLSFTPQGFLDAWGPVFFFAMIFAISMDYTVFLLSAAKEAWDRTHDAKEAMKAALGSSGRVVFAAGAVMVAVFFTFALSGPLPPKEMGIVLGVAVLLDAALIRLMLLPVLLRLTGRAAWWSPAWLRRALPRISLGH
ncbi:MAG: MMPL family transporter [Frankia sp.]